MLLRIVRCFLLLLLFLLLNGNACTVEEQSVCSSCGNRSDTTRRERSTDGSAAPLKVCIKKSDFREKRSAWMCSSSEQVSN